MPGSFRRCNALSRTAAPNLRRCANQSSQDLPKVWDPEDVADYFELPTEQVVGLNATSTTSSVVTLIKLLESVQRFDPMYAEAVMGSNEMSF